MSRYDVNMANTNRIVTFKVQGDPVANRSASIFLSLQGDSSHYPHYGRNRNPTDEQELAQLRMNLVVRALTRYAIAVGVRVGEDDSSNAGGALYLSYEVDQLGVFYNNEWSTDQTENKHRPGTGADASEIISNTVGTGGMPTYANVGKPGLNQILNGLGTVSYDGGTSTIFGALSASNVTLPGGRIIASPSVTLTNVTNNASGLSATFVESV